MVRQRPAKPLFVSSNLTAASKYRQIQPAKSETDLQAFLVCGTEAFPLMNKRGRLTAGLVEAQEMAVDGSLNPKRRR